jgi:hypothetical protein
MLDPAEEKRVEPPKEEAGSPQVYRSRGIFYFSGRVRCPLAGVGSRGDFESNRLVLDDDHTEVTIDRRAARITVKNTRSYAQKSVVCDLMFLAEGTTASGAKTPFSIHLKILKSGTAISTDLHRHLRSQDPMVSAEFEPFEVVVTDGVRSQVLLNKEIVDRLASRPSLALRIVKALMAMRDNLEGVKQDPTKPGFRVADLSVGFGALGIEWMLARAELESLSGENAELIERGVISDMLKSGTWELKITALSDKWLPEVVIRDLFLFGLDELPLLADVRARGLTKGQTMAFRFERGRGEVALGDRSEAFAGAMDVARAYLEYHMLGGLLCECAEKLTKSAGH